MGTIRRGSRWAASDLISSRHSATTLQGLAVSLIALLVPFSKICGSAALDALERRQEVNEVLKASRGDTQEVLDRRGQRGVLRGNGRASGSETWTQI